MKKYGYWLLVGLLLLFSCQEKELTEKQLMEIEVDTLIELYPNELSPFSCSLRSPTENETQWSFQTPSEMRIVPSENEVGDSCSYTIVVQQVGDYQFTVVEEKSHLTKTVEVKCRNRLNDFTLPEFRLLHWGDSFEPLAEVCFDPPEQFFADFDYQFDSSLLVPSENGTLLLASEGMSGSETIEMRIREKRSGIEKVLLLKVIEPLREFHPLVVKVDLIEQLPDEWIELATQKQLSIHCEAKESNPTNGQPFELLRFLDDSTFVAKREGTWELSLCEQWNGKEIPWGKMRIVALSWFSVDFEYQQRLKEEKSYSLVDESEIERQLKENKSFSFDYRWEVEKGVALDDGETHLFKLQYPSVQGIFWSFHNYKCKDSGHWKQNCSSSEYLDSVAISRKNLSYHQVSNDLSLQKSLIFRQYANSIDYTQRDRFHFIPDCHNLDGNGYPKGAFKHLFYRYPYSEREDYPFLKEKMDYYIQKACEEAKSHFQIGSKEIEWKKGEVKSLKTAGTFYMKKNQDSISYQKMIDLTPQQWTIPLSSHSEHPTQHYYSSIVYNPSFVVVERTVEIDTVPLYPLINKVTIAWEPDSITYQSTKWKLEESVDFPFEKSIQEDLENQQVTLHFLNSNLSSDGAILKGVIAEIHFIDKEGKAFSKEIAIATESLE